MRVEPASMRRDEMADGILMLRLYRPINRTISLSGVAVVYNIDIFIID